MNKTFRTVGGLVVSGLFLWLVFRNYNFKVLSQIGSQLKFVWIVPILFLYLVTQSLRAVRWHFILQSSQKIPPHSLFFHLMFGFMVNNILPARAGEFARSYTASKEFGLPFSTLLGSVAVERFSDLFGLSLVMGLALFALPISFIPVRSLVLTLLGGLVFFALLIIIVRYHKNHADTKASSLKTKFFAFIDHLIVSFQSLKSPRLFLSVIFTSCVVWTMEVINVITFMKLFGSSFTFFQGAATISGISFGVMIPASPGYVGTYEYFGVETLKLLGVQVDLAVGFILMIHLFQIGMCFILGAPVLFKFGLPLPGDKKLLTQSGVL